MSMKERVVSFYPCDIPWIHKDVVVEADTWANAVKNARQALNDNTLRFRGCTEKENAYKPITEW